MLRLRVYRLASDIFLYSTSELHTTSASPESAASPIAALRHLQRPSARRPRSGTRKCGRKQERERRNRYFWSGYNRGVRSTGTLQIGRASGRCRLSVYSSPWLRHLLGKRLQAELSRVELRSAVRCVGTSGCTRRTMFIIVKYGNNRTLICNPTCSVVNLLNNIKARTGYNARNMNVDLSDETGLIKDLDSHRSDAAMKHLDEKSTYILVEKMMSDGDDGESTADGMSHVFVPLLENYSDLFPNYTLRFAEDQKKTRVGKAQAKSPSPAGKMAAKSTKKSVSGAPPSSRSNSRTKR